MPPSETLSYEIPTSRECRDRAFWHRLNPELSVESKPCPVHVRNLLPREEANERRRLTQDGYFTLPAVIDRDTTERIRIGIERLIGRGYLPVCIFVYDEVWELIRSLNHLLERVFADRILVQANFWAWHVPAQAGARGFAPHRDRYDYLSSDKPVAANIWLALTNATLDNGCLSVLPATLDPCYPHDLRGEQTPDQRLFVAVPAGCGSLIGIGPNVLHWSREVTSRVEYPRISIAFEVQNANVEPLSQDVFSPVNLPSFDARVSFVAQQVQIFGHHEEVSENAVHMAQLLHPTDQPVVVGQHKQTDYTLEDARSAYADLHTRLQLAGPDSILPTTRGIWHPSDFDDLVRTFGLYAGRTLLDLGCGDGVAAVVASYFFDEVISIEADPSWAGLATRMRDELGISNVEIVTDDYMNHPLIGYDVVFICPDKPFDDQLERKLERELTGILMVYCPQYRPSVLTEIHSFLAGKKRVCIYRP